MFNIFICIMTGLGLYEDKLEQINNNILKA